MLKKLCYTLSKAFHLDSNSDKDTREDWLLSVCGRISEDEAAENSFCAQSLHTKRCIQNVAYKKRTLQHMKSYKIGGS